MASTGFKRALHIEAHETQLWDSWEQSSRGRSPAPYCSKSYAVCNLARQQPPSTWRPPRGECATFNLPRRLEPGPTCQPHRLAHAHPHRPRAVKRLRRRWISRVPVSCALLEPGAGRSSHAAAQVWACKCDVFTFASAPHLPTDATRKRK